MRALAQCLEHTQSNSCDSDLSTGQLRSAPTSISTPTGQHTHSLTIVGFISAPSMDPSMAFFRRAAAFFTCWKRSSVTLRSGNSSSRCVRSIPAARLPQGISGYRRRRRSSRGKHSANNTRPLKSGAQRFLERSPDTRPGVTAAPRSFPPGPGAPLAPPRKGGPIAAGAEPAWSGLRPTASRGP